MKMRIVVLTSLVVALLGAGGLDMARADGPACDEPGYLVCQGQDGPGSTTWLRIGPSDVRAAHTEWTFDGEYDYSRSGLEVIVDGTGVTVLEGQYASTYFDQEERYNTKHVGTDGYHEHEDYSYYGPDGGSFFATSDRSLDANGFEQRGEAYGSVDRTYVDTNPDGGVGAGQTYGDDYGCIQETSLTVDAAAADPALLRLECPYTE
jgi:hypothetical protein